MSSFLDFIENENIDTFENNSINTVSDIIPEIVNPHIKLPKEKTKFSFTKNEDNKFKVKPMNHPGHDNFMEFLFKKGDTVRIIRTERKYIVNNGEIEILNKGVRLCDIYCGYIGEIRQFFRGNDRAIVTLYAPNNLPHIDFPIDCIKKIQSEDLHKYTCNLPI